MGMLQKIKAKGLKFVATLLFTSVLINVVSFGASPPAISGPGNPPHPPNSKAKLKIRPYHTPPDVKNFAQGELSEKAEATRQSTNPGLTFQHTIPGEWDLVVGEIGFFWNFETDNVGQAFVSIIGIEAFPDGNEQYTTIPWERKAFWIDVGDGVPMHLAAEYYGYIAPETEGGDPTLVYANYSTYYRQQGVDYSNTELGGEEITLWLYTDLDNNVLDYEIDRYDENGDPLEPTRFNLGDQIQTWTTLFDLDDPDTIWLTTMEDHFRTITHEPQFKFDHLTPNKDFVNQPTLGNIDFSNIDLQLALFGIKVDPKTGNETYRFSTPKDVGVKWDNVLSSISTWFHFGLGK